jgi:nucleoside-diphosphate-sugar epimerase
MKYLVTGGAGFIGSHIVETLSQQEHEIVILDNLLSGNIENIQPFLRNKNVEFVQGSITDLSLLQKTFDGVDGIFHEAAIASVHQSVLNPLNTHAVNSTGTLNILKAAEECNVKKVVLASSAAIYGDHPLLPKREDMIPFPLSPYAVSKLTGEYYCSVFSQLYGLQTVSLRYFNVFGPRQDPSSEYSGVISKFISQVKQNKPITIFGNGEQTRDFVFVSDVVSANILAMESEVQGVFNVGCGMQTSLNELADLVKNIVGNVVPIIYEPPRDGDIKKSFSDISRAREMLGYTPKYTIREGLEQTVFQHR